MTVNEILKKWGKYSNYNPEQRQFNLLSSTYLFNKAGHKMEDMITFDPTGTLSVLYAKQIFLRVLKESKVNIFDVLQNTDLLSEEKEMWDMFFSSDIAKIEENLLNNLNLLSLQTENKQIGNTDQEENRKHFDRCITIVSEEMTALHEEIYLTSPNKIRPVTRYSQYIHVFNRMSDCVLALERADVQDGIYLCFIRNGDKADCFFTFMIKSAGNIVAVSERVAEAFPGQHANSRNTRWSEGKKYGLFPYNYIFQYSDYDYLGYSTTQIIDDSNLAFLNLGAEVYYPILLTMLCLNNKYAGTDVSEKPVMYFDTLLQWNMAAVPDNENAMIVQSESQIVQRSTSYTIPFNSETVRDWTYGAKHTFKALSDAERKNGAAYGEFPKEGNIFADLYGDGFVLDTSKILQVNQNKQLPDNQTQQKNEPVEFIASADTFDLIAYSEGRRQLAEHIRKKMFESFLEFGGAAAIKDWWTKALVSNKEKIYSLCRAKYDYLKNGGTINVIDNYIVSNNTDFLSCVGMQEGKKNCGSMYHPFNIQEKDDKGHIRYGHYIDPDTGTGCTINFVFRPRNWNELETLFGQVPKPLIGWDKLASRGYGNNLLRLTDPVSDIGSICEHSEQRHYPFSCGSYRAGENTYPAPQTNFDFAVAFSIRGLKKNL